MEESFLVSRKYENNLDIKKRKEQGIYYTPFVVVEYILRQTLKNINVVEEPYPKILDMCCGCGNFMLRAYDILYEKFLENIDNLKRKYGQNFISEDKISLHIIENCIFAVDTDKDALDIFKTQLLLRLKADLKEIYRDKPLIGDDDINDILFETYEGKFNIFCGDSLKADLEAIFKVQKFDYIVGNPPYIGQKVLDNEYKKFLYKEFDEVYKNKGDLYFCFYKRILDLLKEDGTAGIITPRYFMQSPSGKHLRKYLINNAKIEKIIDFLGANLFKGLGIASCIVIFEHKTKTTQNKNLELYKIIDENINIKKIANLEDYLKGDNFKKIIVNTNSLGENWLMLDEDEFEFYNKIKSKCQYFLEEICESFQGIITGCDKAFVVKKTNEDIDKIDEKLLKNWIKNKDVEKYIINNSQYKLIYSNDIQNEEDYPFVIDKFLIPYKPKLQNRRECIRNSRKWYELQWGREKHLFEQKKIMYPYKSRNNRFAIDINNSYGSADVYSFYIKDKYKNEFSYEYLVGVLNTKTYDKYFKIIGKEMGKKIFDYYPNRVMKLKIFKDDNYKEIENLSKEVIDLSRQKSNVIKQLDQNEKQHPKERATLDHMNDITSDKDLMEIQDKKISLLKEKDYLEKKIDFIENIIEERIKESLNLET
ncbi:MAG: N-6 DNA methylase [Intestinibacter bartlettii]|uniref:Eco57I restriction-modification methylase domain-containing protein n=1 Tax=Intestinibacter bartlettii TaxID=261299 RepID=UPI0026F0B344|nr:N-6 DNA methylase [Intestinibacter bartlettii]MDO5009665.1 N-6 DNA methylase [Intestinibacter bartlettii]